MRRSMRPNGRRKRLALRPDDSARAGHKPSAPLPRNAAGRIDHREAGYRALWGTEGDLLIRDGIVIGRA